MDVGPRAFAARSLLAVTAAAVAIAGCGGDPAATPAADTVSVDTGATGDTAPSGDDTASSADTMPACAAAAPCDDGDPCTADDRCDAAGACVGGPPPSCDDALSCTVDRCDVSAGGCVHTAVAGFCLTAGEAPACVPHNGVDPTNGCRLCDATSGAGPAWTPLAEGAPCSDGDTCTTDERCELGQCVAKDALDCAVDGPCVVGRCDPVLGCVTDKVEGTCEDGDPCTLGDACVDGLCHAGADAPSCDDQDACTLDSCVAGAGCAHDPDAVCDDQDACTHDSCLAGGHCVNAPFTGACEDGNPCTTGETCDVAGSCAGGVANDCDDDNVCTLDSCHPTLGCLHLFVTGDCDDAMSCTVDDQCVAGMCFGAKTIACGLCPVTPTDHANKIVSLELMTDGNPGSGLDIDGDPSTCAPASDCGGGVDNALSPVGFLVNPSVAESVALGVVKWVVDLKDVTFDGEVFPLHVYDSALDPASQLAGCDFQTTSCGYDLAQLSFDAQCVPNFSFDNAQIVNGQLVAGGNQSLISMVLPLQGGALLSLTIAWARVRATYTVVGGKIVSMNAIIGGAIPKAQLVAAINGLDPAALPINKEAALQLLDALIPPDIDLDGDGIMESISLGLRINTIPGRITQ